MLGFIGEQIPSVTGNNTVYREHYERALERFAEGSDVHELPLFLGLRRYPDSVEDFLFKGSMLARPHNEIYPEVLEELTRINNPGGYRLVNPYTEAVFTGGIGSAKTTTALYTVAYQLYVLSCFSNPHRTFGMDSTSEILFIFQSIHGGLAQSVDYSRFRGICEQSSYFRTVFPFDPRMKKYLKFPNRIEVKAVGSDTGSIGQNVIGGLIDELNFMAITKDSKKVLSNHGTYNQALTIYNGLSRRRKTRFMSSGRMPGILCLVSSKRYPGEFTDKKIAEAANDPTIYVYNKRVWDVKPAGTFVRGRFKVFVGDLTRKARILPVGGEESVVSEEDQALVVEVPEEFRGDFEDDIVGSLRDIAGVGTLARYPFMLNVEKVHAGFGLLPNVFSVEETDFIFPRLQLLIKSITNPEYPRWAHIDLGVTGDSAGLAIGHVPGFKKCLSHSAQGESSLEVMPIIRFDGLLRIIPPKGDEILFYKIREVLYRLRDAGVNLKWVSFDSFQSVDSIQILRQKGFIAGRQSMDITMDPYDLTKAAFYSGRIEAPLHSHCLKELLSLEKDNKEGKIDHPAEGSKDVSDAMAGVVVGLSMRREVWAMFGVPVTTIINRNDKVKELPDVSKNKG